MGGEPSPVVAEVQRRDFQLKYQLDSQTAASDAVRLTPITGTTFGSVDGLDAEVSAGQAVATVQVDPTYADQLTASAAQNRTDAARLRALNASQGRPVSAPVRGLLVADGRDLLLEAPGIDVVATLSGVQALRLAAVTLTGRATVETVLGTSTVPCEYLWVEAVDDPQQQSTSALHCRLPRTVETAPSLRSKLVVESEPLRNVLVVPNASIGLADDGYFVVIKGDEGDGKVPVDVGPSDGVVRVITTPLPVGAPLGAVEPTS